jgi:hypothetical protein
MTMVQDVKPETRNHWALRVSDWLPEKGGLGMRGRELLRLQPIVR